MYFYHWWIIKCRQQRIPERGTVEWLDDDIVNTIIRVFTLKVPTLEKCVPVQKARLKSAGGVGHCDNSIVNKITFENESRDFDIRLFFLRFKLDFLFH